MFSAARRRNARILLLMVTNNNEVRDSFPTKDLGVHSNRTDCANPLLRKHAMQIALHIITMEPNL